MRSVRARDYADQVAIRRSFQELEAATFPAWPPHGRDSLNDLHTELVEHDSGVAGALHSLRGGGVVPESFLGESRALTRLAEALADDPDAEQLVARFRLLERLRRDALGRVEAV
jgi:hypothetical protein